MILWVIVGVLAVISIILLSGNGAFLIAGYNTASEEKKAKYNKERLCRVAGGGFVVITAVMGIFAYYGGELPDAIHGLMPWGIFIPLAITLFLANTVCWAKK